MVAFVAALTLSIAVPMLPIARAASSQGASAETTISEKRVKAKPSKKKAKKTKKTQSKLSRKNASKSARKKSARQRFQKTAADESGFDLGITELFRGALFLTACVLLVRQRREGQKDGGFSRSAPASGPYAARPVHLDKSPGIDPATVREDHTFVPLGANKIDASLPVLSLDEDDPRRVAAEIDLLTTDDKSGTIKVKDQAAPATPKRKPSLVMPAELASHFTGLPGERLEWQATFASGLDSGMVAITNRRLLAFHQRRGLRLLPPGLNSEVRRHQHDVAHLTIAETGRGYRASFLWLSLVTVWWFPLGTIVACLALGCYFAVTRRELVIGSDEALRRYPLPLAEHENAIAALARAKSQGQNNADDRAAS